MRPLALAAGALVLLLSGCAAAPSPSPTPAAARQSVTLSGTETGKSQAVPLRGNYAVAWTTTLTERSGRQFSARLRPEAGGLGDALVNEVFPPGAGTHQGTTNVFNTNGAYYLDVIGGGDWSFTLTPS